MVSNVAYLKSLSPHAGVAGKTPHEALTGKKPSVAHLRVIGCEVFAHIPGGKLPKFEPKAERCVLVGYAENTKAYRLWSLERQRIIIRRNVQFNETVFPFREAARDAGVERNSLTEAVLQLRSILAATTGVSDWYTAP